MKIRKVINHGNVRYRVTANLDDNRTQRFSPSKRKAKAWMAQANRLDPLLAFWESLPDDDRRQLTGKVEFREVRIRRIAKKN